MLTRLKAFLDERAGLYALRDAVLDAPIPGGARLAYAFGAMLLALLFTEAATGIALAMMYAPSAQTAWASVFYVQYRTHWGGLVRALHHWAADALVVVCLCHFAQVVLFGAYKRPREVNFWIGLALFGLIFAEAHTGTLLPWDQRAYWIARVESEIAGSVPVVGVIAQRWVQGGRDLGSLTLTRLYGLHVALVPLLGVLLVAAHLALYRRHGVTFLPDVVDPARLDEPVQGGAARPARVARYWPDQAWIDALGALAALAVVYYLARRHGAPLEAPAEPEGEYPARPEWYLLWLFRLRKSFSGRGEIIATVVIPSVAIAYLLALPLIDRSPVRAVRRRWPVLGGVLLIGIGIASLTYSSLRHDARDPQLARARRQADRAAARALALAMHGIPLEGPREMVRNDPRERPRELFEEHCGSCHAPPGAPLREPDGSRSAARGPTLAGFGTRDWARALLVNPDADDLFGRTGIHEMPPMAQRLGPEDTTAVIEYLYAQSLERGDPPADAALVARGAEVYFNRCTRCHQGRGDRSETPADERTAPDLTGWGSREWLRDQIRRPAMPYHYGDANEMPAFAEELREHEIEWIIDYVRSLRAARAPAPQPPPPRRPAADAPTQGANSEQ